MNKSKLYFVVLSGLFFITLHAQDIKKNNIENSPPQKGNFSLPISQQPGPLLGTGSNILDKNQTQLFYDLFSTQGNNTYALTEELNVLYGITDNLSIFLNMPIALDLQYDDHHSEGIEDIYLQAEYVYFSGQTKRYTHQSTVLGNVTFPTGSNSKQPPTGFGSYSYLVGTTFNRTFVEWFHFGFLGAQLTTSDSATRYGNQYLYQYGFGRNIYSIANKAIVAWMIEVDGQYNDFSKINGVTDPNSGWNVITVTPSLWLSTQHLILQLGAGAFVVQDLFGDQNKNDYLLAFAIGWTFP